jgi:signal transduction histidine kinase
MSLTPFDGHALIQAVQRAWTAPMQRAMLDFRINLSTDNLTLLGDPNSIQRLLSILLENACKFTPPGGSVTLSAAVSGGRSILSIRDSGIGIHSEDMPRLFDRFFRGTHPDDPSPRGSGLGLALAKWIAERHGTPLRVESALGQGSCFSFSLQMDLSVQSAIGDLKAALGSGLNVTIS